MCIACYSVSYVVKFYYCWIWQIWIVFYVEDCGESNGECRFHLLGVDRVMYTFKGFCGEHSWQNGTRCRDGGSIVVSLPSSLVGF